MRNNRKWIRLRSVAKRLAYEYDIPIGSAVPYCNKVFAIMADMLTNELKPGDRIYIGGFGRFELKTWGGKTPKKPKDRPDWHATNYTTTILKFHPAKQLKRALKGRGR